MLLFLGKAYNCTDRLIDDIARVYSLPTCRYINPARIEQFRRYPMWLVRRNNLILGFTEGDGNCFLVVDKRFYYYYFLYGFCSQCRVLRCSPVWCICGYKELSRCWTSDDSKLDQIIRESQNSTKSANEKYLEWIPDEFICYPDEHISSNEYSLQSHTTAYLSISTVSYINIELISLEVPGITDDLYYYKVSFQ